LDTEGSPAENSIFFFPFYSFGVLPVACTQFLVHSLCEFNAAYGFAVLLEVSRAVVKFNGILIEMH